MNENISIIGGDLRIAYLAKLFQEDKKNVYTFGLENSEIIKNSSVIICKTLEECINYSDIIISGIPFSKDNIYVNTVFTNNKIEIIEIAKNLNNKTFLAGKIPKSFYDQAKNAKIIDIIENEKMAILNSISTAEGAIKIAIEETDFTLYGSNILIMGFGRIGKILAKTLSSFGANIYCEARKEQDLTWIEALGYNKVELKNLDKTLGKYDIIFNTIPHIILDKQKINYVKKDAVIIDLASNPGGVDKDACDLLGIKTIQALSIPGKIAPKSAAEIIKNIITV